MADNAYEIVKKFEQNMAEFVGSPYAVAVDSCTNALFLCCYYHKVKEVILPAHSYISVPCSVIHAGGSVKFEYLDWEGNYQLKPYPIYDSACKLNMGMYIPGTYMCCSFSVNKICNIGKGGIIFTDNEEAVKWFKLARYEGREEVALLDQEVFSVVGWNMYMTPEQAARGLQLLPYMQDENVVQVKYPDLSQKFRP